MSFGAGSFGEEIFGAPNDPTGGANTAINPGAGSITITGYAPTVARTANQSLTPITKALVLTGYAPVIAQTGGNTPLIYHLGTPIHRKTGAERERELLEKYGLADSPVIKAITKPPEKPATAIALAMLAAKENIFTEFLKKPALNTTVAYKIPTNIAITQELLAEMEDEDAAIVCAIAMML